MHKASERMLTQIMLTDLRVLRYGPQDTYQVMTDFSEQTAKVAAPHAISLMFQPLKSMKVFGYIVESPEFFNLPQAQSCPPIMQANDDVDPQATCQRANLCQWMKQREGEGESGSWQVLLQENRQIILKNSLHVLANTQTEGNGPLGNLLDV